MRIVTTPLTRSAVCLAVLALVAPRPAAAQQPETYATKTAAMRRIDGFVPLYWSETDGRVYLEVSRFGVELLYQTALATGLGSNPVGLDRGQLGATHVVVFERVGPRVLLVSRNYGFRASSDNPAERRAVRDSFAESVLWGFTVAAADGGRVLVDATDFLVRDAHGVVARLRDTQQGAYRFEPSRSALSLEATKGFPKNTEVETVLTFVADGQTGPLVRQVAPTAESVTLRGHHSFVELPGPGFAPRHLDPRVASIHVEFNDYATPSGGAELLMLGLRDGLRARGHDARLFASTARSAALPAVADYTCVGTTSSFRTLLQTANPWAAHALRRVLRDFRPALPAGHELRVRQMPTIGPVGGLPVEVRAAA